MRLLRKPLKKRASKIRKRKRGLRKDVFGQSPHKILEDLMTHIKDLKKRLYIEMKGIETIIDLVIIEVKGTALDMKEGTIEEKETVREDIVKDRGLDLNLREGATIEMIALETAMTTVKDQENIDLCTF